VRLIDLANVVLIGEILVGAILLAISIIVVVFERDGDFNLRTEWSFFANLGRSGLFWASIAMIVGGVLLGYIVNGIIHI